MSTETTNPPPSPPNPPPPPPTPPPPAVQRPDGISDTEWSALGDPGKTALVRERERARTAEQALAAARATPPTPPVPPTPGLVPPKPGDPPDFAALISAAVAQAIAPIQERDAQREAVQAAERIRDSVTTAATDRFHDSTDALAQVDLTQVTDGAGLPDTAKITAALDDLLKRKPHLGRAVDDRRRPPPGGAGGPASAPLDDRVKATLARMQSASGVKFAES